MQKSEEEKRLLACLKQDPNPYKVRKNGIYQGIMLGKGDYPKIHLFCPDK